MVEEEDFDGESEDDELEAEPFFDPLLDESDVPVLELLEPLEVDDPERESVR